MKIRATLLFTHPIDGELFIHPAMLASLSIPVSEKLTRDNYRLWRAQVLPTIHTTQLKGFIDGSKMTPMKTLEAENDSTKMKVPTLDYVM
jgi:hypothetical protein